MGQFYKPFNGRKLRVFVIS